MRLHHPVANNNSVGLLEDRHTFRLRESSIRLDWAARKTAYWPSNAIRSDVFPEAVGPTIRLIRFFLNIISSSMRRVNLFSSWPPREVVPCSTFFNHVYVDGWMMISLLDGVISSACNAPFGSPSCEASRSSVYSIDQITYGQELNRPCIPLRKMRQIDREWPFLIECIAVNTSVKDLHHPPTKSHHDWRSGNTYLAKEPAIGGKFGAY